LYTVWRRKSKRHGADEKPKQDDNRYKPTLVIALAVADPFARRG
jgi:hypothetical protein